MARMQKVTQDQIKEYVGSAPAKGRTINETAEHFGVTTGTVRKYVDRLTEAGSLAKSGEKRQENNTGRPSDVYKLKS